MPTNITDVDTFSATVTAPADGDAGNGATFQAGIQLLSNRTRNLKNRADGIDARIGALAGARTKLIPLSLCRAPNGYDATPGVNMLNVAFATANIWAFSANSQSLTIPIDFELETGDIITNVEFCVEQGNAGASGQMSAKAYRQAVSASAYATVLQLGSTRTFTAGAGYKNESIAIASNNTVSRSLYQYFVELSGSALAATNSDYFHWAKITYTAYGTP